MRRYPLFFVVLFSLIVVSCANVGRPEGGPRDEKPPVFVRSNPMPGAVDVTPRKMVLVFDENIQLEDAFNKVVVSPAQVQPPTVIGNGRRVTVEFKDSLRSNTTYTVDFADAIKDLNEGNLLDGFAIDFSTGPVLDSLRISGIVLQASNLEPAQGMMVGAYVGTVDSAITTRPFDRIARTNQLGQFTLRNLRDTIYHLYALKDMNRDFHWDTSEDVAFLGYGIRPTAEAITVTDTLRSASDPTADSLVSRSGVRYLPNDVLLSWFNENRTAQYLKDYDRPQRRYITLNMAAPSDSLPQITLTEGPRAGEDISRWALPEINATRDSLRYWITDTTLLATDTLRLGVRYLRTDTAQQLAAVTDTLRFLYRAPKDGKKKNKKQEQKTDTTAIDTLPAQPKEFLTLKALTGGTHEVYLPLIWEADIPLATIDTAGVHLSMLTDTVWTPVASPWEIAPDSLRGALRFRKTEYAWAPGEKYRLDIDSMAVTDIYGRYNRPFKHETTVRNLDEYSNLTLTVTPLDSTPAFVELLSPSDEPRYRATIAPGAGRAVFRYVAPGDYYARLVLDTNANGRWDTGNIADSVQPEEVYYLPKKLALKKNWDVEQAWDIYEVPVDLQKPAAVKKNKPKLKRGEKVADSDRDEDDEDDNWDNNRRGTGNRQGGTNGSSTNSLGGGFRRSDGNVRM